MTRLQKKCFVASTGMHGVLLLILVGSSAFRDKPVEKDIPILTMIPQNILDKAGAGGGSPEPATAAPPQPAPPTPQPAPTMVHTAPPAPPQPVAPAPIPEPVERPHPRERVRERAPEPEPEISREATTPRPSHKATHEIHPTFDPVTPTTHRKTKVKPADSEQQDAQAAERAAARAQARARNAVAQALDDMAANVKNSGAQGTVVDMPGQGGGEAFAGYETVIYNAYYHAWIAPDSVADKLAATGVKIVVARDGTILSAEIVSPSGERPLDKSVERALRAVMKLPPFPSGAHDEQRSFLIRFNLESKEGSG